MKITYYHTLYKMNVTRNVAGNIEFKDGYANFAAEGHRYSIGIEYIVTIENA